MIGLVLVTHGNLALEFISAMQHVVGKQEQVEAVCIGPEDDMEMRREEILKKAGEVNSGSGTIVLTDMFGGTHQRNRHLWQINTKNTKSPDISGDFFIRPS